MSLPSVGESEATERKQGHRRPGLHRAKGRWSTLREMFGMLVIAIAVSLFIKTFAVQAFVIPSGSMEPTLHGCSGCTGDRVLVNKLTSRMGGVHRGDVVVFRDPGGWLGHSFSPPRPENPVREALVFIGLAPSSGNDLVKRVIGVAGDTVEGRGGKVYVNEKALAEPYVFPGDSATKTDFRVTVPAGKLWVMGDHRSASGDSRFNQEKPSKGFVPLEDVVGQVIVIVWPLERVGSLN